MKNIVIIPNTVKDKELTVTALVAEKLTFFGASILMDEMYKEIKDLPVRYYKDFPKDAELIVVIGGDGSVIDASVSAIKHNIPLVGVNLGKVGYLSEVETDNLDVFRHLYDGNYKIEEKILLKATSVKHGVTVSSERLAVNDVVISRDADFSIADFSLETEKMDVVRYRADGIILATPQGSTAYSLSAGGPIVAKDIDSIVASPICPHSFFNRSIIFSPNEKLTITNTSSETALKVVVDGRCFATLESGEKCVISLSDIKMKMLTFCEVNTFKTLFKKISVLEG